MSMGLLLTVVALVFTGAVLVAVSRQRKGDRPVMTGDRKYFMLDDRNRIVGTVESDKHRVTIRTQVDTREYEVVPGNTQDLYSPNGQLMLSMRLHKDSLTELSEILESEVVRTFWLKEVSEPAELTRDSAYDIWSRSAFFQFCKVAPHRKYTAMLLQFGRLDSSVSEMEVDLRIKSIIATVAFERGDIVARWSDGEIVVLTDYGRGLADKRIAELSEGARQGGLPLRYNLGTWEAGRTSIEEIINWLVRRSSTIENGK